MLILKGWYNLVYEINLTNATLKPILTWKNITISKLAYKENNEETYYFANRRRLGFIPMTIFLGKKVTMNWTSFLGKMKSKTFKYIGGGIVISW